MSPPSEAVLRAALEDWRATVGDYRAGLLSERELQDLLAPDDLPLSEERLRRTGAAVVQLLGEIDRPDPTDTDKNKEKAHGS